MTGNDQKNKSLKPDSNQIQALIISEPFPKLDKIVEQLGKKEIKVHQVDGIRGLVTTLMSRQHIDIVYLSLGISTRKVNLIPQLLIKSFNIETIVFVNGHERSVLNKLNQVQCAHKITGQPSASSFHRALQSVFKEMSAREEIVSQGDPTSEKANRKKSIKIRGNMSASLKDQVIIERSKRSKMIKTLEEIGKVFSVFGDEIKPEEGKPEEKKATIIKKGSNEELSQDEVDKLLITVEEQRLASIKAESGKLAKGESKVLKGQRAKRISSDQQESIKSREFKGNVHTEASFEKKIKGEQSKSEDFKGVIVPEGLETKLTDSDSEALSKKLILDKEELFGRIDRERSSRQMIKREEDLSQEAYLVLYSVDKEFKLVLLHSYEGCELELTSQMDEISKNVLGVIKEYRVVFKAPLFKGQEEYVHKVFENGPEVHKFSLKGKDYSYSLINKNHRIPEVVHINDEITSIGFRYIPENRTLSFEIYLYLEKNKKYYHYLKKGNCLSSRQQEKFILIEEQAYINRSEVNNFYMDYCHYLLDRIIQGDKEALSVEEKAS